MDWKWVTKNIKFHYARNICICMYVMIFHLSCAFCFCMVRWEIDNWLLLILFRPFFDFVERWDLIVGKFHRNWVQHHVKIIKALWQGKRITPVVAIRLHILLRFEVNLMADFDLFVRINTYPLFLWLWMVILICF